MSTPQRASVFEAVEDDLPDLSAFAPTPRAARPRTDKAATKAVAERSGFTSREPSTSVSAAAPAQSDPAAVRPHRRHTTGRNRQLNLKVTDEALARFYALAERQQWVLGQAFEEAVSALETKLSG